MKMPLPGPHGGDGARLAAALGVDPASVLDLSASLNPVAFDPGEIIGKHLDALGRYPDPAAATESMAAALEVDRDCVLLTNGGAEAIALVGAVLGGSVIEPDFSLYPRRGGPVWRSNPHTPSGVLAGPASSAGVWDEAFYPLATGAWTRGDVATGAVVVGSLTKVFACPGLRVGYVAARDPAFIAELRAFQPEWSVNAMAAAAVPDLLAAADLPAWAAAVASLRKRLARVLRCHGLHAEPSDANFVIVKAPGLRGALATHGVLVRDCASFGLPDHVRIAVPDTPGLDRLERALAAAATIAPAGGHPE